MSTSARAARGQTWRLTLRAIDSGRWRSVPDDVRLRRAVKALVRAFGLRAVRLESVSTLSPEPAAACALPLDRSPNPIPGETRGAASAPRLPNPRRLTE